MKEYNPSNLQQKYTFFKMYTDYCNELSQYSQRLRNEPVTPEDVYETETFPLLERYFIEDENGKPIGFMLFGFKENTHPETDWFIAEFYILPAYRHRGYGEKGITKFLQKHPGKYCYFVLKENIPAQKFWNRIREKLNCQDITSRLECEHTPSDCFFEAFIYSNGTIKKEGTTRP